MYMSSEQMPRDNTLKRIGKRIFGILAEHALESIPVYGPYLKIGASIINAAKEELDKGKEPLLAKEQIVEALRSLTYAEAVETIDSVLATQKGIQATIALSPTQKEEVRRRLISLPSDIDHILAEVEEREQKRADDEAAMRHATPSRRDSVWRKCSSDN
jgi:hypothetical protein